MTEEERKLIKFSNYSLCVTLPKSVITNLKWKKGDIVKMRVNEASEEIVISKNRKTDKTTGINNSKSARKKSTVINNTSKKARW
jgi:antitoxin component of MazEF toxin-antitoxin module